MQFAIVHSTQAAMHISFGSCQALRKVAPLKRVEGRVEVTPEWLAECEAKQRAFEADRAKYRLEHEEIKT